MSKQIKIANNEIYHIYNRGVEKRKVFMNEKDYLRFLLCLKELNTKDNIKIIKLKLNKNRKNGTGLTCVINEKPLVDIICYCLMSNHFHLILRQRVDGGIALFMQKLGNSYTGYFNLKYERVGSLFQGTYKIKHIKNDAIFRYLTSYIHSNPLEFIEPQWKEKGIKNFKKAIEFVESYKWSSYNDFINPITKSKIINKFALTEIFDLENYKKNFRESIGKDNINILSEVIMD